MELVYVQFVAVETEKFRLKKLKIRMETPQVDKVEFAIVENIYPFMIPYLFVLMKQGLIVISTATGSKVQIFDLPE